MQCPHSYGAVRHEPEFDLITRQPAGREAAQADADGGESPEQADACLTELQELLSKQRQDHLEKCAEKPKVGYPHHREPERPVPIKSFGAVPDFREGVD